MSPILNPCTRVSPGPFTYSDTALGYRTAADWDRSSMNPKLLQSRDGTWLIFYNGDTYPGPWPNVSDPNPINTWIPQATQRTGMAYANSPYGPWTRVPHPVLTVRPGEWDSRIVVNAAVVELANGTLYMV